MKQASIPVYSIEKFHRNEAGLTTNFQVEVFDANRHFHVIYPHRHDFYEVLFLTQGSGFHVIDDKTYEIKPNTIFFLSPGQIHTIELSKDVFGYIFLFTADFYLFNKQNRNAILELPFFYDLTNDTPPLLLKEDQVSLFTDLFKQGVKESEAGLADSARIVAALLDIILAYCKRFYPIVNTEKTQKGKMLVKRFKQLIDEKYLENIGVKGFADLLAVTPNHLNETVKQYTGLTASSQIDQKVVLEVKRLLKHTELPVTEVSNHFNFQDQSYFSKFFKKHTGLAPLEYRKQC